MRPLLLCLLLLGALPARASAPAPSAATATTTTTFTSRSHALEHRLLEAVRAAGFARVLDFRSKGRRIARTPQVDVAVIELDAEGRPVAAADVLLSRDYPHGQAVPIDARTLGTRAVRFKRWELERWAGTQVAGEGEDLVSGRARAPLRFMAPYPASLFKILIAYGVLRLVDQGALTLDTPWAERPLRDWLEPMIVESDNGATEAMVKLLHERGAMEGLNAELAALGLDTLQVNGTSPATGRNWQPGSIHMTALDTARLFLLLEGGPGVLWHAPGGRKVTAAELSEPSRAFFLTLLANQGYAEGLSSSLVCGDANARPGLPVAVPARWLDPDGAATVGGMAYKHDTRPCNAAAQVEFLHKTGLTENYGSDAGIVRSLPGQKPRHYIIAFLSNLGYRFYDAGVAEWANFQDDEGFPRNATSLHYTQSIAELGRRVDEAMRH